MSVDERYELDGLLLLLYVIVFGLRSPYRKYNHLDLVPDLSFKHFNSILYHCDSNFSPYIQSVDQSYQGQPTSQTMHLKPSSTLPTTNPTISSSYSKQQTS